MYQKLIITIGDSLSLPPLQRKTLLRRIQEYELNAVWVANEKESI